MDVDRPRPKGANPTLPGVSLSPQNTDGKRDLHKTQMRAGNEEAL